MATCLISKENCGFTCTGADFSDTWKQLHNKIVPEMKKRCFNCGSHAEQIFKGDHDHVNAGLGKRPFDKENYKKDMKERICVYNACVARGECLAL